MIENVNNHIHTKYSFSPYSPSEAVYKAKAAGLAVAGIMDHDTVAGAEEFLEASEKAGITATCGFECRCDMSKTPFSGRSINNPDQASVAYLAMHGIPRRFFKKAENFLYPLREKRNIRNRAMVGKLNKITKPAGISLDFYEDVLPVSKYNTGGSVTERHILFALSLKMIGAAGRGTGLADFLYDSFGIKVSGANRERLAEEGNEYYPYYLLNILKGGFTEKFYIDAEDECPPVSEFLKLGEEISAIPAYAYLGDVTDSVTGDKKAAAFEDGYLDGLVEYLAAAGFKALTFMPARNTASQLKRVIALCEKHGLFQISGEDINSPFQPFVCEELKKPEFRHLIKSARALAGHEKAAEKDPERGMFSRKTVSAVPDLNERIDHFAGLGGYK